LLASGTGIVLTTALKKKKGTMIDNERRRGKKKIREEGNNNSSSRRMKVGAKTLHIFPHAISTRHSLFIWDSFLHR
jgi:hypothetical protein